MTGAINTAVKGLPDSCRATAEELSKLSAGSDEVGTGLYRVRSESESCWTGEAGDAFREAMQKRGRAASDLAEAASRGQKALETFADELQTVRGWVRQAREVAAKHGLTVTPTTIEPPGPAPAAPPEATGPPRLGEGSLEPMLAHGEAMADHERKVRGFNEAQHTVERARNKERDAHQALTEAMDYEKNVFESLKSGAFWTLVGVNTSMVTTPQISADKFAAKAEGFHAKATHAASAAQDAALTPAQQRAQAAKAGKMSSRAAWAEKQSAKSQVVMDRLHSRTGISGSASRMLGSSVKGVPILGTAISAGVQIEQVVNDGKPVGKAGLSLAGGTAGGVLGAAAVGAMVGGPVGIVVGAGVGAVAAGVGSWLGEEGYDLATEGGDG
ncbi:hypothetical protein GIY23_05990 [Allosaccharopolyspora coralli]|uniref:Putative T7SS secretion signal domain-containing protein n=1 Tax=Allosaccharopolyspora coralli TaxID=2665642 RepID=A0A5Q3Q6U0_9PSEU|nr:hypothetical protein [Allosaccharopolyspora coralli]QGK69146.1 hypothetical protein GIY23_05990 [Allosaccharopolyspora coralli]